ncbi:MAG: DCC1-like thiol-disulfide oxidoreductase family protein [Bacteroidales bacterium]|jgi:predicted DCC family thiol-disulfide oxidoreductase YuxK|nr:DCC1-like thiol-disulfide oxidoreductase family protein [Bacteroidales bacterium]
MNQNQKNKGIVLFDGFCNLCSGSVMFILKRDKNDYFRFSSLQSEIGMQVLSSHKIPGIYNKSVILIEDDSVYYKSTAALRIAKKLKGLWVLLYFFIIVPIPIRDSIYMIFSRNRFKWFGKRRTCFIADSSYDYKFL